MIVRYCSHLYDPGRRYERYIRVDSDGIYHFCETDLLTRLDYRQGTVDASELPEAVRAAADTRSGHFPSYVEWPHD